MLTAEAVLLRICRQIGYFRAEIRTRKSPRKNLRACVRAGGATRCQTCSRKNQAQIVKVFEKRVLGRICGVKLSCFFPRHEGMYREQRCSSTDY